MPEPKDVDVIDPIAEEAEKEYKQEKAEEEGKAPQKDDETLEAEKKAAEEETRKKEEEAEEARVKEEEDTKAEAERKAKEEGEAEPKSDEELLKAPDEDLSEEELKSKQELVTAQEDEFLDREEKDLSKDEKTQRTEIIQRRDDAKKLAHDTEVKAYAEKKEISEDDARKTIESADKLLKDTFKDDARELARTHQHLQRAFDRTSTELRNLKDAPPREPVTIDSVIKMVDAGKVTSQGKATSREELIDLHRELNPDITADMDDEKVLKLAAKEIVSQSERLAETSKVQFSADAKEKRVQLVDTLSKDLDGKLISDIKVVVGKMSDYQIMRTKSLEDTVLWAKGKNYDTDIAKLTKEAEDRGFRRGQANRRVKTGPVGTGDPPKPKPGVPTLSSAQQDEAWAMFPQAKDDKDAFSLYADLMKDRKKK